ncbi:heme-dependent oxidative N-demethylase family protein [Pararhodobacter marinus]|uniref:heme-dependent oxidative N-demethylase family protein n=1 Tax=Pararhodobacter marinus TaxID=2184063 RepID=UPI00351533CC
MAVLQDALPVAPWMDPRLKRLPGILPLDPADWLVVDEAYAGQMAERVRLLETKRAAVLQALPEAADAVGELVDTVEARLPALGFTRDGGAWLCPDGRRVEGEEGLARLGHLLQEDLCVMQPGPDGIPRLTAAVLCFPASWTLAEKLGRGLPGIHKPVPGYAGGLEARVQRLFEAIRPEQPLWRMNYLDYIDPTLHQPRLESETRPHRDGPEQAGGDYIRCERQCLVRLPRTRAVVFSIHTYVVPRASLSAEEEAGFPVRT